MRSSQGASSVVRKGMARVVIVLVVAVAGVLLASVVAGASATITFSNGPGTGVAPSTLGPYTMQAFRRPIRRSAGAHLPPVTGDKRDRPRSLVCGSETGTWRAKAKGDDVVVALVVAREGAHSAACSSGAAREVAGSHRDAQYERNANAPLPDHAGTHARPTGDGKH